MSESLGRGTAERAEMNALLEATDQARHVMGHSLMTPDDRYDIRDVLDFGYTLISLGTIIYTKLDFFYY